MLALLHTSHVHVEPFGALFREVAPDIALDQCVREDLLAEARESGQADESTRAAIQTLAAAGARIVLCTCSTIGSAAESAAVEGCAVIRVDRPAVEHAVASGRRLLVVAALQTALAQTSSLLEEVTALQQKRPEIVPLLCSEAWPLFERGDRERYLRGIAGAIDAVAADDDLVLLAQASMADARRHVRRQSLEILSTPKLAVQAAVAAYRALAR